MNTTPTGMRIEMCGDCGREHPIGREHCTVCGRTSAFLDGKGVCLRCGAQGKGASDGV
jgi:hypothetical protein